MLLALPRFQQIKVGLTISNRCQCARHDVLKLLDEYAYRTYSIVVRFQFDPAKAGSNLKKHRVSFADAEGVFYDPLAIHQLSPDSENEERFIAFGMDTTGRILVVVYALRIEEIRLISARAPRQVR